VALAADIRIVAPDARLSVMEIKWGLIPDMAGSRILSRLLRPDVAKELTFTGRILSGVEAVELGLATRLSDEPRATAFELARVIARNSPDAVRAGKRLLNEASRAEIEDGLQIEAKLQAAMLGGANHAEAVRAGLEGRPAKFSDPESA
jgi:enoyl-CoA hydratase/carnithine racemase